MMFYWGTEKMSGASLFCRILYRATQFLVSPQVVFSIHSSSQSIFTISVNWKQSKFFISSSQRSSSQRSSSQRSSSRFLSLHHVSGQQSYSAGPPRRSCLEKFGNQSMYFFQSSCYICMQSVFPEVVLFLVKPKQSEARLNKNPLPNDSMRNCLKQKFQIF